MYSEVDSRTGNAQVLMGTIVTLIALTSTAIGAAIAKTIFPLTGAFALAALRLALAAVLLLIFFRPWKRTVPRALRWPLIGYGAMVGLMNLLIYEAFSRIPIGIAVAIELTGPLTVVLLSSRRPRDFLWLAFAVMGLFLLIPRPGATALDPIGVAFAVASGVCWALYIISGKRVSGELGSDAVAWGMLIAALVVLPISLNHATAAVFTPWVLGIGLLVAILSSALPCLLEMAAMRRLPTKVVGLLASAAPAIGALSGVFILDEWLSSTQWLAISFIVAASAGSAVSAAQG